MFAEVAVNRPVHNTFHYHIPPSLLGQIEPGHLVKVSFGTAHTSGIVVALHEHAPIPQTKPILERLDPFPVVTPAQLALARWLSQQTLAPIGLCLWLMLPPGMGKRGDFLYTLIEPEATDLSKTQLRLISLLHRRGPLRGRQIAHALPRVRWQSALSGLVKRGIVRQDPLLEGPDVRPKTVRTARLSISPDRIASIAPRLGRESRRANVLEVLLAARHHRMALSAVMLAVGCTESPIQTLVEAGDVRVTSGEKWVELAVSPTDMAARLAAGEYRRATAQQRVLQQLLAAGGPMPLRELNTEAVKKLEKAGTVRRWVEPAMVELMRSPAETIERIIELRGGAPYLAVLNYLAQASEPVPVREVYAATGVQLSHLKRLAEDGLIRLGEAEIVRDPLAGQEFVPSVAPPLTREQQRVWETIQQYMDAVHWGAISPPTEKPGVFLLHGVTGSGKTEIYLRAVERALAQGRQAIVLVPEIALTPQTVRRFAARFPGRVAIAHSELSPGERYDTWRRARSGDVHVIVGTRSALFMPLPDVGLVILDEEHDDSYKQSPPVAPPYYHARETAIALMRLTRGTVLLGSATPDLVTYFHAERGDYQLLTLPDRVIAHRERIAELLRRLNAPQARYHPTDAADAVYAELPAVQVVDMRAELREGNRSIFSRALHSALTEVLERGEQAILFLNRRGTATFVLCRDCGTIATCPRCNTPLTYHSPQEALICHYCGYTTAHITVCPVCGSKRIRHFGQGTELIESAVRSEFPQARVIRWDADTIGAGTSHEAILRTFAAHQADILIGTQMIAKGLDLPQVTLVGVISADTALGLPDYRAAERTFQLLTQVAGRAGRGPLGGRVVVQSYQPEHYAIRAAAQHDYASFYQQELAHRLDQRFPPFRRLARLIFQYPLAERAEAEAQRARLLIEQRIAAGQFTATEIIGPTPCFFARRNNLYRWHLVVRGTNLPALLGSLDFPEEWIVDLDPVDML